MSFFESIKSLMPEKKQGISLELASQTNTGNPLSLLDVFDVMPNEPEDVFPVIQNEPEDEVVIIEVESFIERLYNAIHGSDEVQMDSQSDLIMTPVSLSAPVAAVASLEETKRLSGSEIRAALEAQHAISITIAEAQPITSIEGYSIIQGEDGQSASHLIYSSTKPTPPVDELIEKMVKESSVDNSSELNPMRDALVNATKGNHGRNANRESRRNNRRNSLD